MLCPPGASTSRKMKVQAKHALPTDGLISSLVHTHTASGSSILVAGSVSGKLCSWEVSSWPGRPLHTFLGHSDSIYCLLNIPDLEMVATGSLDSSLRLWNVNTGKPAGPPMEAHTHGVSSVVFVEERQLLLSAGSDRMIYVWNLLLQEKITALTGHSEPVSNVVVVDSFIVSTDCSCTFRVWDMVSFSCVQSFSLPESFIAPLCGLSSVVVPNKSAASIIVAAGNLTLLLGSPDDVPAEPQVVPASEGREEQERK